MSASNFDSGRVGWTSSGAQPAPRIPAVARGGVGADRFIAWLMILLLCASVTVAVYDLYLLLITLR